MHTFRITTHAHLPGVYLSCDGGWGNVPYPSAARAEAAARISAGRDPHTFVHERAVPRAARKRLSAAD